MTQEHVYYLSIEKLMGVQNLFNTINLIKILFDELTRVLIHMLVIACHALDIGSMFSIFWAFEERENIIKFYERVSGAKMHAAFYRTGTNFNYILTKDLLNNILKFIKNCYKTLNEMHNVLIYNKIWKQRLVNIRISNPNNVTNWGLTGVMVIKKIYVYPLNTIIQNIIVLIWKVFLGISGDCYDKYLIRMFGMAESLNISNAVITTLLRINQNYPNIY